MVANSQLDLTVCLENVHDPHNISAVMRTCDAIGIREIHVLYTDPELQGNQFAAGKRSSSGSAKWVQVHVFEDEVQCFDTLRERYDRILTTHFDAEAVDLFNLDLAQPAALVFGNERDGLSNYALQQSDGNFLIPHVGMVPSLNISVACAVTLFEAYRQRKSKHMYRAPQPEFSPAKSALLQHFIDSHSQKKD